MAWLDSRFHKVIQPLTNPTAHGGDAADAFTSCVRRLKPARSGWNVQRIARVWPELMPRLGYKRYGAQGGDWGAAITTCIGIQDPANCIGIHLNMPIAPPDPGTANDLTEKEKFAIAGIKYYNDWVVGGLTERILTGYSWMVAKEAHFL